MFSIAPFCSVDSALATNNIISDQIVDGAGNPFQRPGGGNATLADLGLDTVPVGNAPPVKVVPWSTLPGDVAQMQQYGDHLYFGTTPGQIWEYDMNGVRNPTPLLDVDSLRASFSTSGPFSGQGLRGFAFHPDFANNGLLYTMSRESTSGGSATFDTAGGGNAVAHYALGEWDFNDLAGGNPSYRSVMRVAYPATDHVASQINFDPTAGPGDADYGNLYIAFGDGGGSGSGSNTVQNIFGYGQNMQAIQSSLIRINPLGSNSANGQYGIPADNPFAGANDPGNAVLDEIYAKGFRNPTTMLFDVQTGALYSGDISQNTIEELNLIEAGNNYGWGQIEGTWLHVDLTNTGSSMRYIPLGDGSDVTATSATYVGKNAAGQTATFTNINRLNDGFTSPVAQFSHERNQLDADNLSALVAGSVYRGAMAPGLQGKLLLSNLSQDEIYYVDQSDLVNDEMPGEMFELRLLDAGGNLVSLEDIVGANRANVRFGQDAAGELYLISKYNDTIYRFEGISTPGINGDINLDSVVDLLDVAALRAGWLKTATVGVESWQQGDLNLDGITDLRDAAQLRLALLNSHQNAAADVLAAFVPEPQSAGALLAAFAMTLLFRGLRLETRYAPRGCFIGGLLG
ncbi:MAG: PQQ-dependent sugar dehydrogenase [Planctomycetales bacterium]|nr:PQQ-dependent sugar dehydrogenase [Planctomycetales bacterium]